MLFFGRGWRERTGAGVGLPQMRGGGVSRGGGTVRAILEGK